MEKKKKKVKLCIWSGRSLWSVTWPEGNQQGGSQRRVKEWSEKTADESDILNLGEKNKLVLMDRREKGHRGNTQKAWRWGGWGREHVCGAVFTDNDRKEMQSRFLNAWTLNILQCARENVFHNRQQRLDLLAFTHKITTSYFFVAANWQNWQESCSYCVPAEQLCRQNCAKQLEFEKALTSSSFSFSLSLPAAFVSFPPPPFSLVSFRLAAAAQCMIYLSGG